jgi:hypothetical protein
MVGQVLYSQALNEFLGGAQRNYLPVVSVPQPQRSRYTLMNRSFWITG